MVINLGVAKPSQHCYSPENHFTFSGSKTQDQTPARDSFNSRVTTGDDFLRFETKESHLVDRLQDFQQLIKRSPKISDDKEEKCTLNHEKYLKVP